MRLDRVTELSRMLSAIEPSSGVPLSSVSVAELERAGAVTIRPGRPVPDELLGRGDRPEDAVQFLSMHDLMTGDQARNWVDTRDLPDTELTVAEPGDIVVEAPSAPSTPGCRSRNTWSSARNSWPCVPTPSSSTPGTWRAACGRG